MDNFLPVFDALCADQRRDGANTLLLGEVAVALGDTPLPPIPFVGRLNDLVGELFGYAEDELPSAEHPDLLGARATFSNTIESPVRIDRALVAELIATYEGVIRAEGFWGERAPKMVEELNALRASESQLRALVSHSKLVAAAADAATKALADVDKVRTKQAAS